MLSASKPKARGIPSSSKVKHSIEDDTDWEDDEDDTREAQLYLEAMDYKDKEDEIDVRKINGNMTRVSLFSHVI